MREMEPTACSLRVSYSTNWLLGTDTMAALPSRALRHGPLFSASSSGPNLHM